MKKYILVAIFSMSFPLVSYASWWNPFTWHIFNREIPITPLSTPFRVTTTPPSATTTKLIAPVSSPSKTKVSISPETIQKTTKKTVVPVPVPKENTRLSQEELQKIANVIDLLGTSITDTDSTINDLQIKYGTYNPEPIEVYQTYRNNIEIIRNAIQQFYWDALSNPNNGKANQEKINVLMQRTISLLDKLKIDRDIAFQTFSNRLRGMVSNRQQELNTINSQTDQQSAQNEASNARIDEYNRKVAEIRTQAIPQPLIDGQIRRLHQDMFGY